MADLTFGELQTLWIQAGGSKAVAPVMAAIALAESSGNPGAINPNDNHGRQSSFGLWQISNGTHAPPSPNWANPRVNAALAVAKYQASGFAPWGTYPQPALTILSQHGGQAPAGLPSGIQGGGPGPSTSAGSGFHFPNWVLDLFGVGGAAAAGAQKAPGLSTSIFGIAGSLGNIADTFGTLMTDIEWLFVPSHWVRIIAGLFGTGTLIAGVLALSKAGQGDVFLAMGIGLVTFAGILLFVAFHNLDPSVKDLGGLMGAFSGAVTGQQNLLNEPKA